MDQLYGELVRTPDSDAHKARAGLQADFGGPPPQALFDAETQIHPFQLLHQMHQQNAHRERLLREAAHQGYLQLRGEPKFPSDNDCSDLRLAVNLFGGILTFAGLDAVQCFDPDHATQPIDIAIVGAPFDTGTSFRPGARFGPDSLRLSARRLHEGVTPVRGSGKHSRLRGVNPYDKRTHNLTVVDCGDVPMTPFDNRVALNQLYRGERAIRRHETSGNRHVPTPRVITMGGDHTVTLMALRAAYEHEGKLAVLHFDSHIDTWDPAVLGGGITDYMSLNHGTFLHYAAENGYLLPQQCFHVGLRAPYIEPDYDRRHDADCGFKTITARDIDTMGVAGIVRAIKQTIGEDNPVYISVDIDVLDPAHAPGTGTMEIGGWSGRELLSVLDGLEGLNVVGADVVEVSPPFDTNAGITSLAGTAVIDSILGLMVVKSLPKET